FSNLIRAFLERFTSGDGGVVGGGGGGGVVGGGGGAADDVGVDGGVVGGGGGGVVSRFADLFYGGVSSAPFTDDSQTFSGPIFSSLYVLQSGGGAFHCGQNNLLASRPALSFGHIPTKPQEPISAFARVPNFLQGFSVGPSTPVPASTKLFK